MSTEIQIAKNQVKLRNWMEEADACRASGMTVQQWCEMNGISVKTYYYHLRKVREAVLQENSIVPLGKSSSCSVDKIEISSGDLKISLPEGCAVETITAVLKVLKDAQ